MIKKTVYVAFLMSILLCHSLSFALSQQVSAGLNYLSLSQNPDGSWGNTSASLDTDLYSTAAAIETLSILGQTNLPAYTNALLWLNGYSIDNAGYLAARLSALAGNGIDLSSDIDQLLQWKNADGGWGGVGEYVSSNFHTALALLALKQINYQDQNTINSAINFLLGTQKSDGGWGFDKDAESEVYYAALISSALQQFSQTTSIATAINKATSYLIAHQNSGGGFGEGGASPAPTTTISTVYETAFAYMALVGVITDNTVLGGAINYLSSIQLTDGSWDQDPYSTALALRALYISENLPAPPPPPPPAPTTGTITGRLSDASTNLVLSGVSVSAISIQPSVTTTTDSTGAFSLANIPQGNQTITFSLAGYGTASVTVNFRNSTLVLLTIENILYILEPLMQISGEGA